MVIVILGQVGYRLRVSQLRAAPHVHGVESLADYRPI